MYKELIMSQASEIVDKIKIGSMESVDPVDSSIETLEHFQTIVSDLHDIESQGKIKIIIEHKESATGKRLVDYIQFKHIN